MQYRPEIDGLRAVAVLPVVLFHAGIEQFAGGFVGVDVFFVISGYLITSILLDDLKGGNFSIVNFYERRARRILPALLFVVLCCIPFAWMWMPPTQLKDFSQSLAGVSLFSSNFLFWLESGYFEAAAEEKPLLHTWSLAVEEQYYVFFPILLFFMWRFARDKTFWVIAIFAALSFALAEWGWKNDPAAKFYLAPARVWELFAGSIAAFIVQKRGVMRNDWLALLGMAAIIISIFVYDEHTPFPGKFALAPVVGTVLLVLFAGDKTVMARVLSGRLLVGIGLISYSVYLWHQPLFAFARIYSLTEPSVWLMLLLAVCSIGLGVFSWHYIEKPFRGGEALLKTRFGLFGASGLALSAFVVLGVVGYGAGGFPGRLDAKEIQVFDWFDKNPCTLYGTFSEAEAMTVVETCFDENAADKYVLIGDSHAATISLGMRRVIEKAGGQLVTLAHSGCFPIAGVARAKPDEACQTTKAAYLNAAIRSGATIVISTRWALHFSGVGFDNGEGGVERKVSVSNQVINAPNQDLYDYARDQLIALGKSNRLILISQVPEAGWDVPSQVFNLQMRGRDSSSLSTSYSMYKQRNGRINSWLKDLETDVNISLVRVAELICDDITDRCENVRGNVPLYIDNNHPSPLFSEMIANQLLSISLN